MLHTLSPIVHVVSWGEQCLAPHTNCGGSLRERCSKLPTQGVCVWKPLNHPHLYFFFIIRFVKLKDSQEAVMMLLFYLSTRRH